MYESQATNYDNLVVGGRVVTDNVMIATKQDKGTVLASYGVATSAVKAKKSITFTGTPVASEAVKIKINGQEVSYTTTSTTLNTEVAGLKAAINAASTGAGAIVTADNSSGKLTLEVKAAGKAGNDLEVEFTAGDSGMVAGNLTVEVVGEDLGDERFTAADTGSGTSALQTPVAILLEDAEAGDFKTVAFCGEFNKDALKFASGMSLNNFKVALRKIGIFAKACI